MEDLTEVAMVRELRRKGFSFERMGKVVRFLQETIPQALAETGSGSSNYHLHTDSRALSLATSPHEIVDLLKTSRQPMFALCLNDTVREGKGPWSAEGNTSAAVVRRKRVPLRKAKSS